MNYQVTLFCGTGKYKPVSAIVTSEAVDLTDKVAKKQLVSKGATKICAKHYWSGKDLTRLGYVTAKVREYDPEKIAKENIERYEKIKAEKYASGEWKRPKFEKEV